jgi:hypothetical protein
LQCLTAIHEYFAKSTRRKKKLREYLENVNATIRENQKQRTTAARARATAGRRQPAVELEHINPDDALDNVLKVLVVQHKLPQRIVLTRWLSSVEAIKVVVTSRATYEEFFQFKSFKQGHSQTFMSDSRITVYLGVTTAC